MHSKTMKLTVVELSDVMQTMRNLLLDHHRRHGDPAAQTAAADILQVLYIFAGVSKHVL